MGYHLEEFTGSEIVAQILFPKTQRASKIL